MSKFFAPNGGCCVNYPSNVFLKGCSFENISLTEFSKRLFSHVTCLETFRPITYEQKYLMDYKLRYLTLDTICFSKLTVFLEFCSQKTVRFLEPITSADEYPSVFLCEAITEIYVYALGLCTCYHTSNNLSSFRIQFQY